MILCDNILKNKDCFKQICKYNDYKPKSSKCIVLGSSNESLSKFDFQSYINNRDCDIFSIQKIGKYVKNNDKYNHINVCIHDWKIDNLHQWNNNKNYDDIKIYRKFFTFTFLKYLNECFVEQHKNELYDLYYSFINRHFTTGFYTILYAMYMYNKVEICGFGFSNNKYKNTQKPTYFYEKTDNKMHNKLQDHDFNLEHGFYDKWQKILPGLFYRCEEKYELK